MQIDLDTLKQRVLDTARRSPVATKVEDIVLEPDRDEEGTDFLRVFVQLNNMEDVVEAEFEALLEAIERTVGDVDERYPSVRFLDAA